MNFIINNGNHSPNNLVWTTILIKKKKYNVRIMLVLNNEWLPNVSNIHIWIMYNNRHSSWFTKKYIEYNKDGTFTLRTGTKHKIPASKVFKKLLGPSICLLSSPRSPIPTLSSYNTAVSDGDLMMFLRISFLTVRLNSWHQNKRNRRAVLILMSYL